MGANPSRVAGGDVRECTEAHAYNGAEPRDQLPPISFLHTLPHHAFLSHHLFFFHPPLLSATSVVNGLKTVFCPRSGKSSQAEEGSRKRGRGQGASLMINSHVSAFALGGAEFRP